MHLFEVIPDKHHDLHELLATVKVLWSKEEDALLKSTKKKASDELQGAVNKALTEFKKEFPMFDQYKTHINRRLGQGNRFIVIFQVMLPCMHP